MTDHPIAGPGTPAGRTGVILAGGLGTRLRSVLPETVKPVAPVRGRPFLTFLLEQLVRASIDRIVLCTGHRGEQVRAEIGTSFQGVLVDYSVEDAPLGTGGALRMAYRTQGDGRPWLVMNGDSFLDIDLDRMYASHEQAGMAATIAAVEAPDGRRFGSLEWSPDGRIVAFREKSEEAGPKWVNGGIYLFEPRFLEVLPATAPLSLEQDVFPHWIPRGLHIFSQRARFIDIGTPDSYSEAQRFFS